MHVEKLILVRVWGKSYGTWKKSSYAKGQSLSEVRERQRSLGDVICYVWIIEYNIREIYLDFINGFVDKLLH